MTRHLLTRRYENQLYFPRVFGPRQCARIVEAGLTAPGDTGYISTGSSNSEEPRYRKSGVAWLEPAGEHQWIFDKLDQVVRRANRVYRYDLSGFTEDAQFTRYDEPGAFYDWHQDGLEGELAGRKLSLVVQLSDPAAYAGSDLELFGLSCDPEVAEAWREDLRAQGSVTVFPAFEFHRVTPLKKGHRYSLVCWIGGPPFR